MYEMNEKVSTIINEIRDIRFSMVRKSMMKK